MTTYLQPTRAQLAVMVADLTLQLQTATSAQLGQAEALFALEEAMAHQAEELNAAQAHAAEAKAQAATAAQATVAAAAHTQAQGDTALLMPEELIPKPDEERFNIKDTMQVLHQDFLIIRATIHNLVKSTQLNWQDDFCNLDPTKLGLLFKAAKKEHPILKCYVNNWATATIARTYMQNMHKYTCKQGYIPAWQAGKNARHSAHIYAYCPCNAIG
ncbi:hypothetical protein V8D89_006877 [Ganoderma adspersum]